MAKNQENRSLLPSELDQLRAEPTDLERAVTNCTNSKIVWEINEWLDDQSDESLIQLRDKAGLSESDCPIENINMEPFENWPREIRERFASVIVDLIDVESILGRPDDEAGTDCMIAMGR